MKRNIEDELRSIDQRLDKIAAEQTEPKNQFGDTAADKERMATAWLTRPKTKPWDDPKFFQKKLPTKENEKFKYQSWNGETEPMEITKYIDKVKKNYE